MRQVTTFSADAQLLIDIDKRVKTSGFTDRSSYIQYLCERDIYKKHIEKGLVFKIIVLIELSAVLMLLTLLI